MLDSAAIPTHSNVAAEGAVETVRAILERPDDELDYASAKIAFDRLVDPSIDEAWVLGELDRLTEAAWDLAGTAPDEAAKLNALRKLIYTTGPWNGWRFFEYDYSNFRGQNVRRKLLSEYLKTKLGDCVSMPVLFLILAERLGLDMALSLSPNHIFVKLRFHDGRVVNLEPTSGAGIAREVWMRHLRPMSDRSIASGMYLRTLSRREGIASMALSVVQFLRDERRFWETAALCELILTHNPLDGLVLINLSGACGRLYDDLCRQYPSDLAMPLGTRLRSWVWLSRNRAAAARAGALGWEDIDGNRDKEKRPC